MPDMLTIDIVYARLHQTWHQSIQVAAGTRVGEAIKASNLAKDCGNEVIKPDMVGIYGRRVSPETVLQDGDRIEIYRPLSLDPKEARRRRAVRKTANRVKNHT